MKMLVGREWLGSAHPEPLCHSEQLPCLCSGNAPPQLRRTQEEKGHPHCTRTQEEKGHHLMPSPP